MIEGWSDFYFLMSSSSAGLIGLLFVVETLIAGVQSKTAERGQVLFMTPVVFHFAMVMTVAAFCTSARLSSHLLAIIVGVAAAAGLIYMASRMYQLRKPGVVQHWSDYWYYGIWPIVGYAALAVCALGIEMRASWSEMTLPLVLLAFVLLGVRNAWDLLTWIAPRTKEIGKATETSKPSE